LQAAAARAGVDVHTGVAVEAVSTRDGRAAGVRLRDGSEVPASDLVLALPPLDALRVLPSPHLERLAANLLPAPLACLDLALDRLPSARYPVVFDLERPCFVTAQSTVARIAPLGGAVIHAFKQLDPRRPSDPQSDRAHLEALLDTVQAGWREHVVRQQFLPHLAGSSLLPQARTGGLAGRPGHRSPDVPNVYFAGDWVGPRGFLADAVFDSAREAARLILRQQPTDVELPRAA